MAQKVKKRVETVVVCKPTPDRIIRDLRSQILVHACLYYWLIKPVLTDYKWDELCAKLEAYQNAFPEACKIDYFDEDFDGFRPGCGFGLPYDLHEIIIESELFHREHLMKLMSNA